MPGHSSILRIGKLRVPPLVVAPVVVVFIFCLNSPFPAVRGKVESVSSSSESSSSLSSRILRRITEVSFPTPAAASSSGCSVEVLEGLISLISSSLLAWKFFACAMLTARPCTVDTELNPTSEYRSLRDLFSFFALLLL